MFTYEVLNLYMFLIIKYITIKTYIFSQINNLILKASLNVYILSNNNWKVNNLMKFSQSIHNIYKTLIIKYFNKKIILQLFRLIIKWLDFWLFCRKNKLYYLNLI